MTPVFTAISDSHLGRVWGAHCTPATRTALSNRYFDPVDEVAKLGVPILHGGDWHDKAHNSEAFILRSMAALENIKLVVAGNHDHVNREGAVTSLQLMEDMDSGTIVSNPDVMNDIHVDYQRIRGVGVHMVPHHATQAQFEQALQKAALSARDEPSVLITHCNVGSIGGGKPDSCLYLTPQLVQMLEPHFDYILVGHEHLPRQIGKVVVMGSTQPCNFGELGPRFRYDFHLRDGKLEMSREPLESTLTHKVVELAGDFSKSQVEGAELILLKGILPANNAKEVQGLVRHAYASGALAVKVDVAFDNGTVLDGEAVHGSLRNLVQVVQEELAENKPWLDLFNEEIKGQQ